MAGLVVLSWLHLWLYWRDDYLVEVAREYRSTNVLALIEWTNKLRSINFNESRLFKF